MAGYTVILIGDYRVAKELLEKHSAKHSSRPTLHYINHHIDPLTEFWALAKQGPTHSLGRRLSSEVMSTVRLGMTEPLQRFEALLTIQHLLDDGGKDWFHWMDRFATSTALSAGLSMHFPTGHEPDIKAFMNMLAEIVHLATPTSSVTNVFPFLDFLPGPMPWRVRAQSFREKSGSLWKKLLDDALGKGSAMHMYGNLQSS
ncbi:hypothetical protein H0H92_002397 [Tricholoma furcatifolium]|nr:hypothetical protein H0H92_002397 [Tricholoma furcatifolium]